MVNARNFASSGTMWSDRRRFTMAMLMVTWFVLCSPVSAIHEVFCTSETFNAACNPGHVVVVRRALYGRLAASRCITSEYAHALGCYADVTSHVTDACSGADWRQNCSLLVATVDAIAQPCGKDFKSYLDIEYDCVTASYSDDCTHGNVTILTATEGYLALFARPSTTDDREAAAAAASSVNARPSSGSGVSVAPGHGDRVHVRGKSCPWLLLAETGRRFNVSWRLPAALPSMSTLGGSSANRGHQDDDGDDVNEGFEREQHHERHQQRQPNSIDDDDDHDRDDVIVEALPVIAVCSATWKIVDGTGVVTVPSVSMYAACQSGVDGRASSVGSNVAHVIQSIHADRTYHSVTNRIEIRYTGSVEALAAAEEGVFGRHGQFRGGADDHKGETAAATGPIRMGHRIDTVGVGVGKIHASPLAILHYKVIGCTDVTPPEGAFVSRHLDSAAIICNQSAETWYVTCRDGHWSGYVGNCTTLTGLSGDQATLKPTAMSRLQLRFENGVVVAIMVGITLGTIAGAILLGIVFNINRKSSLKRATRSSLRHPKYKDPYSFVSAGSRDQLKHVSGACRQHAQSSLSSSSRRFDDVIYPALLFDDQTAASVDLFNSRPVCRDCACAAAVTSSSQCVDFSTSDPIAGNATGSETSLPDCTGAPPSIGGSPIAMRIPSGHQLPRTPPPPVSSMSSLRQFTVPVVPPPLLRVVRPPPSTPADVPPFLGRRLMGAPTTWGVHEMSLRGVETEGKCHEAQGLCWRPNRRQIRDQISDQTDFSPTSDGQAMNDDTDSVTTCGHFARYRTLQQQQPQKHDSRDVSILADARLDAYGRSTVEPPGGDSPSVVYRI